MNPKDHEEFMAFLEKRRKLLRTSKKAAREYLDALGLLTPTGKLKRRFMPPKLVPAKSSPTHK